MPIEVDADERLRQIAEATLRVAERDGSAAITIRSVAAELGGSTAVVTNYAATRADLVLNVILHVQRQWDGDMRRTIAGLAGVELLRALVLWSVTTDPQDPTMRRLWVDLLAKSGSESDAVKALADIALRHRALIRDALVAAEAAGPAGAPPADPETEADVLYLMIRGFYFLSVEDPQAWTEERVTRALAYALDRLVGDGGGAGSGSGRRRPSGRRG